MIYDYIIIGGGIVGISTAWQLQTRNPGCRVLLLEKEDELSQHQTGHNSGVIHAGVYYAPGSLKADFCRRGASATIEFCKAHKIAFDQCGKLLVATSREEYHRMLALAERCKENGIAVELLDNKEVLRREPNVSGVAAIYVPETGIVNYRQIAQTMAKLFTEAGGDIKQGHRVIGLSENNEQVRVDIHSKAGNLSIRSRFIVACAGLAADRIASLMNIPVNFRIIPFRGEYYRLSSRCNDIVKHLIYPIPDPDLPFLGVHLTRMIDGSVTIGPNAVLGFKREGYDKYNFNLRDCWDTLRFPGFWRLARNNWRSAMQEFRNSWQKQRYLELAQKYCPQLEMSDLEYMPAGVRAQAVMADGSLVHDFLFVDSPRSLHVCNAPSPAATSAIPIGEYICGLVTAAEKS